MTLPLYAQHATAGAVFEDGTPLHYGDQAAEYRAALDSAALFDLSDRGKVELRGPDARIFLHNLCTNTVKDLPAGAGCEAFLTTTKARIVAHVWVAHLDGALLLDMAPGQAEKVLKHLDHYLISEQVELIDRSAELALLRLCGPAAGRQVEAALGVACHDLAPLHLRGVGASWVRRQRLLGLDGYDIICPVAEAEATWAALVRAGAKPAGRLAYEVLRVEAGLPEYGPDIDEDRLAMETGRTAQAISYAKGCYLGQETIVMARDRGQVNRQLMGVTCATSTSLQPGTKLFRGADEVGQVTSSVFSPRLGKIAALAYLRRGSQAPGTELLVEPASAGLWVTVASLPFVSPADQ